MSGKFQNHPEIFERKESLGVSFLAESGKWGRDSGRFGAGLEMRLTSRLNVVNFRVDYDHEVFDHTAVNEFSTTLGMQW